MSRRDDTRDPGLVWAGLVWAGLVWTYRSTYQKPAFTRTRETQGEARMTERELLESIRDACRWKHLLCYHTYRSTRSEPGFPDLVIITRTRILFRELKADRGRLTAAQTMWLDELTRAGADVAVWRPVDWPDRILTELGVYRYASRLRKAEAS